MVKYLIFILVIFLMGDNGACKSDDECGKTKAPEINFKFLVGGIINVSGEGTGKDLTNEFEDFTLMMNKVYCNRNTNGPFEVPYLISTDGQRRRLHECEILL